MNLSRVRGVRDILEHDTGKLEKIITVFKSFTQKASYNLITLPTLEEANLYTKSLGESSDIVSKEMFEIKNQSYVLRPEGTAGAIRAYLNNCKLGEKKQWSYVGSMFRHERPQKMRFREFIQFGVESISSNFTACSDAECIILAHDILEHLKLDCELHLNTLADEITRKEYNLGLEKYFKDKSLSKNSQVRAEKGKFLRILDSKEPEDLEIIEKAPSILDYMQKDAIQYFDQIQRILNESGVKFIHNPRLVRGLDYYSNVCFEFIKDKQALVGGGRYDNLAGFAPKDKHIGGIGWAAGIDRISEWIDQNERKKIIGVVPIMEGETEFCLNFVRKLRRLNGFEVKMKTEAKGVKQHMAYLKELNPDLIVFIGEDEIKENQAKVKICESGDQILVPINEFFEKGEKLIDNFIGKNSK